MNNELEWEVITDPEKLFHLKKAGWDTVVQTEIGSDAEFPLEEWDGRCWHIAYEYRARPPKPKMKQVTIKDDDDLRFIKRVLEGNNPTEKDKERCLQLIHEIRSRARNTK